MDSDVKLPGSLAASPQQITDATDPTDPTDPWGLAVTPTKVKGFQVAELRWTVVGDGTVTIHRNDIVKSASNTGSYTDEIGTKGGGSYVYKVCNSTSTSCSAEVTVTF